MQYTGGGDGCKVTKTMMIKGNDNDIYFDCGCNEKDNDDKR